ncbi:MAG TPA: rhodanese-like domain-containing protein [Candidatus Tenderia sp.]|nr:rhodanese-like domain-containing protein [Candidatus Tenderia sp.]
MGQFVDFVVNNPLLFAAFIAILVMLVMNEFKRKLLGFTEVGPNDAVRLMNQEDAAILDVREDSEYQEGHVLNAIHIPLGLLEARLDELDEYREKPLIVYCRSGQRSAKAGAILRRQGFKSLYKLSGGMMAWTSANMPVSR